MGSIMRVFHSIKTEGSCYQPSKESGGKTAATSPTGGLRTKEETELRGMEREQFPLSLTPKFLE